MGEIFKTSENMYAWAHFLLHSLHKQKEEFMWEHSGMVTICNIREEASERNLLRQYLDLGLPGLQNYEK